MGAKTFIAVIAVLAVIALLAFGLRDKNADAIAAGDPVPEPDLTELSSGSSASLEEFRGKWLLLNMWSSWCEPCREEAPDLQRFYEQHRRDGFEVLGVDTQDATDDALAFADEFGLTYPQVHDGSGDYAQEELHTTGVPENFLVDPEGNVAFVQRGPVSGEILDEQVAPLIEGG